MPPKAETDMAVDDAYESGSDGGQVESPDYGGPPVASTSAGNGTITGLGRRSVKGAAGKAAKRSRSSTVDSEVRTRPRKDQATRLSWRAVNQRADTTFVSTASRQTEAQAEPCRSILRAVQETQGPSRACFDLRARTARLTHFAPPLLCDFKQIKCDRKLPCESCIKRGEQASCRWEQPKVEPPP